MEEKLLTVRDVSSILGVTEREVMDLAEEGKIPAYKVGGVYLRFKREQVEEYKKSFPLSGQKTDNLEKYSFGGRLGDFFYFNDFYIISVLIIGFMLVVIFRGY